ncbi:50S ribosomal protein L23, partial [Acinetobacter baumannii]
RTLGRLSDVKKAYVTLKAGQDVDRADLGDTAESAAE